MFSSSKARQEKIPSWLNRAIVSSQNVTAIAPVRLRYCTVRRQAADVILYARVVLRAKRPLHSMLHVLEQRQIKPCLRHGSSNDLGWPRSTNCEGGSQSFPTDAERSINVFECTVSCGCH